MSSREKKGQNPKYVIHKSGYHSVKSPLNQKKKKSSYPDQFILLNKDIPHRKLEFHDEINIQIEPTFTPEYCFQLNDDVKTNVSCYIQKYFRSYFSKHPMKVNKSIQPRNQRPSRRVVLELK